ncbi:MAG: hypothetical protein CVV50_00785, partial [Spirochaetae bacterium HGW-Spirochaetae-6]
MQSSRFHSLAIAVGVFLVSLAIISLQIALNRMFSLTFWYHFAFLIISIALFGIGLGGMSVYFVNRFAKKQIELVLGFLSMAVAVFIVYSFVQANNIPLETNVIAESAEQQGNFVKLFLLLAIPFTLAGMIFSFVFTNYSEKIHSMYFSDLIGGGIGCLFALLIFPGRGPVLTSVVAGIVLLVAAVSFIVAHRNKWVKLVAIIPLALIGVFAFEVYPQMKDVKIRVSKSKKPHMDTFGPVVFDYWDNFSYVTVHSENNGRWMRLYGDFATNTPMMKMENRKPEDFYGVFKNHVYPFKVHNRPENVAIVGAGGGREVIMALNFKAKHIDAIEFNPTFVYIMHDKFKQYSGNLVDYPGVNFVKGEGRYFIQASDKQYDIIIFNNAISQTASSSGAYSLSESYLYTVEAFQKYMEKLTPSGILYLSNPYPDAARFASVTRETFRRMGREKELETSVLFAWTPKDDYKTCKVVIKNSPFTPKELAAINAYVAQNEHQILYSPGVKRKNLVTRILTTDDLPKVYEESETDIRPSTDNWPFFTQRVKLTADMPGDIKNISKVDENLKANKTLQQVDFFYSQPFHIITAMVKEAGKLSLLFLLLPLILLNFGGLRKVKNKFGAIFYFLSLGMGFMLIEVIFMQKYILFLGHPIYSFSVVLCVILIATGLGSLLCKKIAKTPFKGILIGLAGIIVGITLNMPFFTYLGDLLISSSFGVRIALA